MGRGRGQSKGGRDHGVVMVDNYYEKIMLLIVRIMMIMVITMSITIMIMIKINLITTIS